MKPKKNEDVNNPLESEQENKKETELTIDEQLDLFSDIITTILLNEQHQD